MRIKLLFLSILAIVITALFFNNINAVTDSNSLRYSQLKVDTLSSERDKLVEIQLNDLKEIKEKEVKADQIKSSEAIYDSDPVVDANIIIRNHKVCFSQLSRNARSISYVNRFKQKLNKRQKQFYEDIDTYCQQLNKEHPEYSLTDISVLQDQKNNAKASSFWGRIINGELDVDSLSDYDIKNLLKQNNLNILSDAPNYLRDYYLKVIHWELEDILQNHQYDYINLIRHYAHQHYLCDLGSDCGPNSTIMVNLCYINSQSCGLDYSGYIDNVLTPGQKADIELAMNYLSNQYQ